MVDDTTILFPFNLDRYKKSVEELQKALEVHKVDQQVIIIACSRITDVIVNYDFDGNGSSISSNAAPNSTNTETKIILDEISVLIEKYKDLPYEVWQQERTKRYDALRQTINDNIPESWDALECVLTAKGILHIKDITLPLVLILIGNPSTWKTVGMLRRWPNTYYTDDFNPASFVSHANVDNKEDLEYIDMVRQMKDKLSMMPELSPLFMKHEEKLSETLSKLVRLADGEGYLSHSGLHGRRGIDDKLMFSMIGATVQVPNKVYKVLSSLGPKLYFFRTKFQEPETEQLLTDLKGCGFELKIRNIKNALFEYLKWLEVCPLMQNVVTIGNSAGGLDQTKIDSSTKRVIEWDQSKDEDDALKIIVNIALFLARLRGNTYAYEAKSPDARLVDDEEEASDSDSYTPPQHSTYNFEAPIIENATRANRVLYNISKAHAFEIHGRNYITLQDIPIAIKIALSSGNHNRVSVLRQMITEKRHADVGGHLEHKRKFFTTDLASSLNISKSTIRRVMKELEILGIVTIRSEKRSNGKHYDYIELLPRFNWLLEDQFQNLIKDFDWDTLAGTLEEGEDADNNDNTNNQPKPIHRVKENSDIWVCNFCQYTDDRIGVLNHLSICNKNPANQTNQTNQNPDNEKDSDQTRL